MYEMHVCGFTKRAPGHTGRASRQPRDWRDGTNANLSWNCGAEGATTDAKILAQRARDVRALLVTLFAERGTPMLSMGRELGRSHGGNNNAYAQDNAHSWIDWASMDVSLVDFVARLIQVRRSHGALNAETPLTGAPLDATGIPDVEWLTLEGRPFSPQDWSDPSTKTLMAVFYDPGACEAVPGRAANRATVLISDGAIACTLPERCTNHVWALAIDSGTPDLRPPILADDR